jgi:AhpD family alkylhydroperoxidase
MARVSLIEPKAASREVQQIFEHRLGGRPLNLHKAMAHNPQALVPFLAFHAAVGKSLDRRLWELVYVRVSFLNGGDYCAQHHAVSAKKIGLGSDDWKALRAGELSRYSASEQAALRYAEKLTQTPGEIRDFDTDELKRHFRDDQIVDLHLLIGLANLINRFTGPLGLELEFSAEML